MPTIQIAVSRDDATVQLAASNLRVVMTAAQARAIASDLLDAADGLEDKRASGPWDAQKFRSYAALVAERQGPGARV